jgi:hypothetical protein
MTGKAMNIMSLPIVILSVAKNLVESLRFG